VNSTAARFSYHFDTIGSSSLRYIVESNRGCRDTLDTALVVYPYPIAKINQTKPYACQKRQIKFYDSSNLYSQAIFKSYWNWGDGGLDTNATRIGLHTYKNYDTFNVRLITETINGCRDTADSTFIVYPVTKTAIGSNISNLCKKQNKFEFLDNSTIPFGSFTNAWIIDGSNYSNQNKVSNIHFADSGIKNIYLITTTDKGCIDTVKSTTYVAPEPKAMFQVTDSNTCYNSHF